MLLGDEPFSQDFADPSLIGQTLHKPGWTPMWVSLVFPRRSQHFIQHRLPVMGSKPLQLGSIVNRFHAPQFFGVSTGAAGRPPLEFGCGQ